MTSSFSRSGTPSVRRNRSVHTTTFGSSKRFQQDKEASERPLTYTSFKSFDHRANGRAVSEAGSFSTAANTSFIPKATTSIAYYDLPPGVGRGVATSHGVKRTAPRFSEPEDDSVGPIYNPPSQDPVKSAKFGTAPRFPSPSKVSNNSRHGGDSQLSDILPDLSTGSGLNRSSGTRSPPLKGSTTNARARSPSSKPSTPCTFGSRTETKMYQDRSKESALEQKTFVEVIPKYKGRWGKSTKAQRPPEVLPGPGHFLKNEYQNTTAKWSFGRRTRDTRSQTPGPGAYNIAKYSKISKPDVPTFARRMRDTLDFASGKDSPGPALYATFR